MNIVKYYQFLYVTTYVPFRPSIKCFVEDLVNKYIPYNYNRSFLKKKILKRKV